MNKSYTIFFFGIILFSIGLYNYEHQTSRATQIVCNQLNQICVSCPDVKFRPAINVEGYTHIRYSNKFKVLAAKEGNYFSRINCRQFLRLIKISNFQIESEELESYFSKQLIKIQNSLIIETSQRDNYYLRLINQQDFIVFYKNQEYRNPSITIQSQVNYQKLLKFQRSISWSLLFTLILKTFDRKAGIFSKRIQVPFPFMEIIISLFGIIFGSEIQFFKYQHVAEMMFLTYMGHKVFSQFNEKLIICLFLIICLRKQLSPFGYLLVFAASWRQKINLKSTVTLIIIISVGMPFILNLMQTNFMIYANHLWKIIMYPFVFLQFQLQEYIIQQTQPLPQDQLPL